MFRRRKKVNQKELNLHQLWKFDIKGQSGVVELTLVVEVRHKKVNLGYLAPSYLPKKVNLG